MDKLQRLAERVEKTKADLDRDQEQKERLGARIKLIRETDEWTRTDFWCGTCREDILGCRAYKVVFTDLELGPCAYYESYRACHKRLRRFITDKHLDPYYRQSQMLREQAQEHRIDLLQPGDPGFNMYYGDPQKKYYEQLEAQERANHTKRIISSV